MKLTPLAAIFIGHTYFSRGVASWYLGVAESMGHALKMLQFENWDYYPEMLSMQQSRNYNEVPVPSVCLYFCHNVDNLFHFLSCVSPKGIQPSLASHPIYPCLFAIIFCRPAKPVFYSMFHFIFI